MHKINSITAWSPNKASSGPTADYKGESRSCNWTVFLITLYLSSGNVSSVVVVLLQVYGSSEERGGAAEETESARSLILHSLRYTHTHMQHFDHSLLLDGLNAGNHNAEMTFSRSHGKIQTEFLRLWYYLAVETKASSNRPPPHVRAVSLC